MAPACDLAIGPYCNTAVIACLDGRVYLVDKENLPALKVIREIPIN